MYRLKTGVAKPKTLNAATPALLLGPFRCRKLILKRVTSALDDELREPSGPASSAATRRLLPRCGGRYTISAVCAPGFCAGTSVMLRLGRFVVDGVASTSAGETLATSAPSRRGVEETQAAPVGAPRRDDISNDPAVIDRFNHHLTLWIAEV